MPYLLAAMYPVQSTDDTTTDLAPPIGKILIQSIDHLFSNGAFAVGLILLRYGRQLYVGQFNSPHLLRVCRVRGLLLLITTI